MERFRVHYWDKDGEAQEAIVEGEDDGGAKAAESIDDLARLGYIESVPADEPARRRPRRQKQEG
jgi:hypothetical protein